MPRTLPVCRGATQISRAAEARRNEELVLAESALLGERRVAWVRIAMVVLFGMSEELIPRLYGRPMPVDWFRIGCVIGYLAFAFAVLAWVYRSRPDPQAAHYAPFILTLVDFGFLSVQGVRDVAVLGHFLPAMGAIAMAVVLSFSVARAGWVHVAFSTFIACVSFLAVGAYGQLLSPVTTPFVMGGFLSLGLLMALTNHSVRRMFVGLRSRDNLSRFLPRQLVERLIAGGESALAPTQCEVTVLFSDLRDFTSLSESLAPREVLEFLDDYFGRMAEVVKGHDGLVNKFLGDGMLAFWGVPDRSPEHAELALKAALDMRKVLEEINERRLRAGALPIRFGIGIHTGTVAAGMLGGADQHEYTVIGDAVNVASRIEGLTKTLDCDILLSESTWQKVAGFSAVKRGEERVKGRLDPVVVYALDPTSEGRSAV